MNSTDHNGNDQLFVAVIGGANVDIHGVPDATLRLNDSNPGVVRTVPGGVARNIAENLARLGADSRLMAAVGNDQFGHFLLQQGRAAGIDMDHMLRLDESTTSTYLSVLDQTGDMHLAVSDMAIFDRLGADWLQQHESTLKRAAAIVVDTNLQQDALTYLAATVADQALFVDTVSTTKALRIKSHLEAVHTLKPSLPEAEALAGLQARTDRQLPRLAGWFHDHGVPRLFVTLGERGVFYSTEDAQGIEQPATRHAMSNASGAGDAFLAGIVYAWLKHWPLKKSLLFAQAAASVTLSHGGTNSPALSLATVNRLLEIQHAE